jgi:V/A-type H+-transporting ATPase subunit D
MAGVKLTKNELKKQKDALKRFRRYLPTLQLKKQQLQMVIRQVEVKERELSERKDELRAQLNTWIQLFGEEISLERFLSVDEVTYDTGNIAGVDIPQFTGIRFTENRYDLYEIPLWVDAGLDMLKSLLELDAQIMVLRRQIALLGEELRITTQRVNLFEKVKIPSTRENIRKIQIYLGDQQTAAVVRGKIAKNNMVKVTQS